VQRAILAGDKVTGVTIMGMERGLDTGPMFATRETPVVRKTAGELTDEIATIGAALMVDVLERLGELEPVPQPEDGRHLRIEDREAGGAARFRAERRAGRASGARVQPGSRRVLRMRRRADQAAGGGDSRSER
jgi:methionyl-tRNA formyltransferase